MVPFLLRLYGVATWLLQPLLRRKLRRRAQAEPGYALAVPERFGHYLDHCAESGTGDATGGAVGDSAAQWCWVHAVSLGEARAAGILIAELRRLQPGLRFLLTHGTATGREEGTRLLQPGDRQVWQPWDTPGAVARFLAHFRPRIGILMETEVWPVLTAACAARGIPLVLANARLNEKSLEGARRLAWIARPAYAALAAVWAQTEADAQRLVEAGAKVDGVFGNLKFDATPDLEQLAHAASLRTMLSRPVLMLASSREGEEQQLLDVLARLRAEPSSGTAHAADGHPAKPAQWLIVPRHPQRFDAVAALIEANGFTVARRSSVDRVVEADIWLGDSLGEMALYYGLADVALLGGSFELLGGQNLIEAAACGCPVLMGPSTYNFAEAAELSVQAGAALRTEGMAQAVAAAVALAGDRTRHAQMVRAGLAFASSNRGAAARTAAAVLAVMASCNQGGSKAP